MDVLKLHNVAIDSVAELKWFPDHLIKSRGRTCMDVLEYQLDSTNIKSDTTYPKKITKDHH